MAVLHGDLCKEPLTPKHFEFYNPDEHKRIIVLLEEKNPAAVVTLTPTGDHMLFAFCGIPIVAVTASNIFGRMGGILRSPSDNMDNIDMDAPGNTVRLLAEGGL